MDKMKRTRRVGVVFLTLAALTLVLVMFSYARGVTVMQHYTSVVIFAFAGMTLFSGAYGKRLDYWLGAAFVGWYIVSRILLRELYLDYSFGFFVNLSCAYLLAFPFAHGTNDAGKQGLKAVAAVFVVGYGLLAWLGTAALVLREEVTLPWLGTELKRFDMRLYAGNHPNISACVFLIGLMLGVWLAAQWRRRWVTAAVVVLGIGMYAGIALTVSRTAMLQLSCFAAGLVVLGALRLRIPALWKRLGIGIVVGALCAAVVFAGFDGAVWLAGELSDGLNASAEVVVERNLLQDMATMTGRTDIYRNVFRLLEDRPGILLTGMRNSEMVQVIRKYVDNEHAHNSFLQTLVNMGLPALLMAVWFAARALFTSLRVIFSQKARFGDQLLAVALLVLLVGTIPEPYLFSEYLTACNFPFFLLLGYTIETERALRA